MALSETPFADALAQLGPMLGPDDHGGVLVRATKDHNGETVYKGVFAVKAGDHFHLGTEFDWKKGGNWSVSGEVAATF